MLVEAGLDRLRGLFEILLEVLLAAIKHFHPDVGAEIAAIDQKLQAAPGRLDLLKRFVMQHPVELGADHDVDLGDEAVEQGLVDPFDAGLAAGGQIDEDLDAGGQPLVEGDVRHLAGVGEGGEFDVFTQGADFHQAAQPLVGAVGFGRFDGDRFCAHMFLNCHIDFSNSE